MKANSARPSSCNSEQRNSSAGAQVTSWRRQRCEPGEGDLRFVRIVTINPANDPQGNLLSTQAQYVDSQRSTLLQAINCSSSTAALGRPPGPGDALQGRALHLGPCQNPAPPRSTARSSNEREHAIRGTTHCVRQQNLVSPGEDAPPAATAQISWSPGADALPGQVPTPPTSIRPADPVRGARTASPPAKSSSITVAACGDLWLW